jgi:asparagine synthase (glutamine-hydrolysing)
MEHLKKNNKVSNGIAYADGEIPDQGSIVAQLGFMPSWIRGFSLNKPKILEILSQDTLQKFGTRDFACFALNALDIANQIEGRDLLSRSLYLWSRLILPHYLLTVLGDRMEMAHSIEGRVPFLDHRLVDYVVQMPSNVKIKGMIEKYALREAAKPYITKTIYERQKHPFLAPPASLAAKKNAMAQLIEESLRSSALRSISFVDQNKVIKILDTYKNLPQDEKAKYDILLMSLTSACMIQKRLAS